MKTIILTGGGTAGHVMPNVALLPSLRKEFKKIYYIGTEKGIESSIIKKEKDVVFIPIKASKLIRKFTLKNLMLPLKLLSSICECKKILKELKPSAIFSKGGYASVPVVIAAKKLKIPVVSHESDLSMGLANKIIYRYCKSMCTSFLETSKGKNKCVCTGSPIRESLLHGQKSKVLNKFNQNKKLKTILFFGGSLGAGKINEVVFSSLDDLTKKYNVLHITGKKNMRQTKCYKNYFQTEFANNIEDFFDACDLAVCRSGSNSIFELLALKKRMLLIPLPKEESRGDQIENAFYFKKKGYADVLEQKNLSKENLIAKIDDCLKKGPIEIGKSESNIQLANQKILEQINKAIIEC
ncbi:MAG: undecaprenyldiphospho-muramoylpentapeptide beta-N-acetylglucosaminyltransferase [Clostridia bacterium]